MQSPLRKLRKSHGFTLSHVAFGVQIDPATLSRIERCEQVPSVELAERLANYYHGEISETHILYPSRYQTAEIDSESDVYLSAKHKPQ
jgi:transcriptional regulator with XRE-family HTH domain